GPDPLGAHPEVEGQEERAGEREEQERHGYRLQRCGDSENVPGNLGPGGDRGGEQAGHGHRLGGDEIEPEGAEGIAILTANEVEPAGGAALPHPEPARENLRSAALRAAAPKRSREHGAAADLPCVHAGIYWVAGAPPASASEPMPAPSSCPPMRTASRTSRSRSSRRVR